MSRALRRIALALGACCLIAAWAGCDRPSAPTMIDPLRIAVLPDKPRAEIEADYAPLVRYLSQTFRVRAELIVPATSEELAERFHRGEFDLAYLGGLDFAEAERRDGAAPLVVRANDRHFTSVVIARAGLEGKFPEDFRGKSFAFGSEFSALGARLPREFFARMKIEPESFFSAVRNLRGHNAVINAVASGRADAGVVSARVLRTRLARDAALAKAVRQVWESPAYTTTVWVVPARISPELRLRLTEAFVALDAEHPDHKAVLAPLGTPAFAPATRADFAGLREPAPASSEGSRP